MIELAVGVMAVIAAAAAGASLLRVAHALPDEAGARGVWRPAVGCGVWGVVGLGLAAAQALRPTPILLLAAVGVVTGGPSLWRAVASLRPRPGRRAVLLAIAPTLTLVAL